MKRLALVLPVLLLAACGGGDDGAAKAAYLAKAETVCTKANAEVKALTSPTSPAAIVTFVNAIVNVADRAKTDLEALTPPAGDVEEIKNRLLTPLSMQVDEGRSYATKIAAAVRANDNKAIGELIGNPPTQTQADTAWMSSYGFKACVESAKTAK